MMKLKLHIAILLVISSAMVYYLYSYKPRNYNTAELVLNTMMNVAVWFVILGVPYFILWLLAKTVKR